MQQNQQNPACFEAADFLEAPNLVDDFCLTLAERKLEHGKEIRAFVLLEKERSVLASDSSLLPVARTGLLSL
jgi:hypothetical protein